MHRTLVAASRRHLIVCAVVLACGIAACNRDSSQASDGGDDASVGDGGLNDLACVDTQNDPNNCGTCGNVCGAQQRCVNGACTCPIYQSLCGGKCIPTNVDPDNCGGCGVVCSSAQACSAGKCSSGCLPGLTICNRACVDLESDNANCGMCGRACPTGQGCSGGSCVPAAVLGPAPAACADGGPPINVVLPGQDVCAGNLAQVAFTWGLCSCNNVQLSSKFIVDAFDSTQGPYTPGGAGGGVGLNGNLSASSEVDVSGTMWSSATGGVSATATTKVGQALHVGGPLSTQTFTVGHDAFVAGNINAGMLTIGGILHHMGTLSGTINAASKVSETVTVPPPCACADADVVPVAAIVAARVTNNDNALIGLDAEMFTKAAPPQRLDLPCGNYYFTAMPLSGPLTIAAHGHTAIYIGGDVTSGSMLRFTLDPTAELDIFIGGTITTSAELGIGSPNYPALTRTYVGGTTELVFTANVALASNLYDAAGAVRWTSNTEAYGAVFAKNFTATSDTKIHYDRQVTKAGQACPAPGGGGAADGGVPGCGSCRDCGNQACISGTCGKCTDSSQCCPPLQCGTDGTCFLPVL